MSSSKSRDQSSAEEGIRVHTFTSNDGANTRNTTNDSSQKGQEKEGTTEHEHSKEHRHSVVINMEGNKDQTSKPYNEVTNNLPSYWVQFNLAGGNRLPEGQEPMSYQPERNYFVRVVFSMVLFMFMLTAGFVMFVYMSDLKDMFLRFGLVPAIVGMGGMIGLNYTMMCCACSRVPPCNFICLFLAVCFMSILTSYVTVRYRTDLVLMALLATTVTVMVCLCIACTSFDFTRFLLFVIVISVAVASVAMVVSIFMLVTHTHYKPLTLVILGVGTIVNVVVLVIELQMILGGRAVELSEDDYALGAFMLYTSIVDIFLKLVQILGISDSF
ncbi:unnamed protein product [Chrysodeixis includens]|uniref:Uncharacterized protein n=1 Tax=Chrysodeixis includens TaxID=689277 RepID=A0A9P0BYE3_CHRIL|nr:unnamed protein product [Chrysodeixis includens]